MAGSHVPGVPGFVLQTAHGENLGFSSGSGDGRSASGGARMPFFVRLIIMCPQKETASQIRSTDLPAVPFLWHFLCKTFTYTRRPSMCGTELRNNKTR